MTSDFSGRVVIVAGAGPGSGAAIARLFAQNGAQVVVAARTARRLEQLAADIRAAGGQALAVTADLSTSAGADLLAQQTWNAYGRVDVLCNNTGLLLRPHQRVGETPRHDWDRLLAANLSAAFYCSRAILPFMLAGNRGVIINVGASRSVRQTASPAYAASKQGLVALTEHMARDYRGDNIRINCILPGPIVRRAVDGPVGLPAPGLNRPGTPEDVAHSVLYLASDAASWITGAVLTVDGGSDLG